VVLKYIEIRASQKGWLELIGRAPKALAIKKQASRRKASKK